MGCLFHGTFPSSFRYMRVTVFKIPADTGDNTNNRLRVNNLHAENVPAKQASSFYLLICGDLAI